MHPDILSIRIDTYLQSGGLFNPESMEHDKVRNLILDLQKYLKQQIAAPPEYFVVQAYSHTDRRQLWKVLTRRMTNLISAQTWCEFEQEQQPKRETFVVQRIPLTTD